MANKIVKTMTIILKILLIFFRIGCPDGGDEMPKRISNMRAGKIGKI